MFRRPCVLAGTANPPGGVQARTLRRLGNLRAGTGGADTVGRVLRADLGQHPRACTPASRNDTARDALKVREAAFANGLGDNSAEEKGLVARPNGLDAVIAPEPGAVALLGVAGLAVVGRRRRRRF